MMSVRTLARCAIVALLPAAATAQPAVPTARHAAAPAAAKPVQMAANMPLERVALGGQNLIQLAEPATRIALGDPSVVDVKLVSNRQLRLVGLKEGNTDLTIWSKANPDGQAFSVVVGPNIAALRGKLAAAPALQNVTAVSTPQGVSLEGVVANLEARQQAVGLAQSEVGKNVTDQLSVADRRMVAVDVRFAAVSTSTLKALGINFQKLGGGFQFASGVTNSISQASSSSAGLTVTSSLPLSQAFNLLLAWPGSDVMGAISALGSVNLAQLLAEPTLMVRSGDEANFLAGGEIPIPVPQGGNSNGSIAIEYRKFGVQLHVHATVMKNDRIVIRINPEVSELDYQNALTLQGFNVPAIRSRSTNTTIELGDGQSFVLAGLMYSASSNIEEKVPGLGSLPIIGDFFKRSQRSSEQQELIIIATPHLVSPMAPGRVPKLPGEGLSYQPSLADTLLNVNQLDGFADQYGLAR